MCYYTYNNKIICQLLVFLFLSVSVIALDPLARMLVIDFGSRPPLNKSPKVLCVKLWWHIAELTEGRRVLGLISQKVVGKAG